MLFALAPAWASTGQEGASFLDIPVGAEPAALGSAYTAVAENAYAPVWNPAGLAGLDVAEASAMHTSYLESIHYDHLSGVFPLHLSDRPSAVGVALQLLGSGDIDARDENGNPTGSFSTSFGAYSLSYGQAVGERSAVGGTLKMVHEKIADVGATAFALDLGWLFHYTPAMTFAAALSNAGTSLKLVDQSDPLPLQARVGTAWRFHPNFRISDDLIARRNGPFANALGLEWSPAALYALRFGYNTSHTKELGVLAGLTAGFGLRFLGQEFAYAWVPFGDLGDTHYFSLQLRFSTEPPPDRAFPELQKARLRQARGDDDFGRDETPATGYHDYGNIYDILNDDEKRSLQHERHSQDRDAK